MRRGDWVVLSAVLLTASLSMALFPAKSGAAVFHMTKMQGSFSDSLGNPMPQGQLVVLSPSGEKIGEGRSFSSSYEITFLREWKVFEYVSIKTDFAPCTSVRTDDLLGSLRNDWVLQDLECDVKCSQQGNRFFCAPINKDSRMIEFS